MKIFLCASVVLAILTACSNSREIHLVSIFKLVVLPEKFLGETVQVVGFLNQTDPIIYITEDLSRVRDRESSLFVDDVRLKNPTRCRGKYVAIQGQFVEVDLGDSVKLLGFSNIEVFREKETFADCFE